MATVTTNSQTDLVAPPPLAPIARSSVNGYLYVVVRTASTTLTVYRSTDSGGSWASFASFTQTGLQEWSRLVVDKSGYAHIAYRCGDTTYDNEWYRRLNLSTASFSAALQTSSNEANSGTIGSRSQGIDLAVVRNSNGSYVIGICIAHTYTNNTYGMVMNGVAISTSGTITLNNGLILNKRFWTETGTAPGRSGVSCEVEHNGDGFTSSTPHLWASWGRTSLRMVKLAWQGSSVGWSGPSNHQIIRSGIGTQDYCAGRYDGAQWLMPVISPDDATKVRVYQRNQANTLTTTFDTPTHPQGNIRNLSISYDNSNKNIRVFAVGTSAATLYFVDFNRATSTWNSWATVSATAVLGTNATEWGVRYGGSSGNARHDVITCHSGSPNTVVHTAQTVSSTPDTATWDTSTQPYFNGGAADVNASLTLDWNFSDPDPGQGQGSYALSRQIGAGTIQYWNAGTSTWGASEVQNSSATTQVTLASGWGAGTDANHSYKVKVWDSVNTPAAAYSAALVLIPSVKVDPSITTPTAAQVLNTDTVTMTWTAAEQTSYRVRLLTNPGGTVVHDSGYIVDTALTYTVPVTLPTVTGWTIELTTTNNEGLASTAQTRNFTVVYAAPPAMISTVTPVPASGWMTVTPSSLTAVGVQPTIVGADLYRRVATTPVLNSNPDMAGNVTGWQQGGGGAAGTLSYSTTQFHSSPGAARYVPPAASGAALQSIQSSGLYTLTAGQLYYASGWIRPDTGNKPIFIGLDWYDASNVFISTTGFTVPAPVAAAWQFLEVFGDPSIVAGAAKVRVAIGETTTPASTDAWYADDIRLEVYSGDTGVRLAAAASPTTAFNDWGAASGVDYEYRWLATGNNGTSVYGPWL